ncbi:MAG TPA: type I phosphomannose isomerase catalytic subunit, partial [Gammaproteobacteria bacterium]
MPPASTAADLLLEGDRAVAASLATRILKPWRDNLVERPWGGVRMRAFKRLPPPERGALPVGESFEIAADDGDEEARQHPSVLTLDDGSRIALPALLAVHADTLLGDEFVRHYGRRYPLLPKLLDVAELLSIQAHPPGNTEVYVIVDVDHGATIRLGFAADVSAETLAADLSAGRREQQRLLDLVAGAMTPDELQAALKGWFARRNATPDELQATVGRKLGGGVRWPDVAACLALLHGVYWRALEAMNAIPVAAGDVIYNANPPRVVAASGQPASAEVHALGNPEGRGILALEIRRPGPTMRAWDNVRFPLRPVDIDAALANVNLTATEPKDFIVEPRLVRAGVRRSVDCDYFRLEHFDVAADSAIDVPASKPHSLHALAGKVAVQGA